MRKNPLEIEMRKNLSDLLREAAKKVKKKKHRKTKRQLVLEFAKRKRAKKILYRDAITGRFCSLEYAKENPNTSVAERK